MKQKSDSLGLVELVAIAIGGMVGGGIFTILGISVAIVGASAPFAIALGGLIAFFAAYSYVQLGVYYKDEGATYAFYKRTYPSSPMAASMIGWFTIFGYISTLSLYAYTFASYSISGFTFSDHVWIRKAFAIGILWIFVLINLWSVKGMGKIEDLLVYIKLLILFLISAVLIYDAKIDFAAFTQMFSRDFEHARLLDILIVSSVTFVAYEGFQLVINAVKDMETPEKNIPRSIYIAILLVASIYFIIAFSAVMAIPMDEISNNKEYALAAGAEAVLGGWGRNLVILGAVLATSSAISGTIFGASRQMARIADDGYFPSILSTRNGTIASMAVITMGAVASVLILIGGLRLILEFGSITFLLVSLLMAIANFRIRAKTNSSTWVTLIAIAGLGAGGVLILGYEYQTNPWQLLFIVILYMLLGMGAWGYAKFNGKSHMSHP